MKKFLPFILTLSTLLTGCATSSGTGPAASSTMPSFASIDGSSAAVLGQEYRMIADLFSANGYKEAAVKFDSRARAAQNGQWIYPDPPPEDKNEQIQAYDDLNGALLFAMNKENVPWLARAQVNYDCWINAPSEDECRRNFDRAMHSLTLPDAPFKTDTVYFGADSSEIPAETYEKLQILVGQMRMSKNIAIKLIGHSNGGARNQSLALRRAIALRNMISQMGVSPNRITVDNEAHADTVLSQQKPEKGGDALDRRVDIVLKPVFRWES